MILRSFASSPISNLDAGNATAQVHAGRSPTIQYSCVSGGGSDVVGLVGLPRVVFEKAARNTSATTHTQRVHVFLFLPCRRSVSLCATTTSSCRAEQSMTSKPPLTAPCRIRPPNTARRFGPLRMSRRIGVLALHWIPILSIPTSMEATQRCNDQATVVGKKHDAHLQVVLRIEFIELVILCETRALPTAHWYKQSTVHENCFAEHDHLEINHSRVERSG
jgi:hypothetical protein